MGLFSRRRPRVDRLSRKGDVEGLLRALGYHDRVDTSDGGVVDLGRSIRREAIAALRDIDDERVLAAAREAIDDDDDEVRLEGVAILSERGASDLLVDSLVRSPSRLSEPVLTELRTALLDFEDPWVGVTFARAFVEQGEDAAIADDQAQFIARLLSRLEKSDREGVARAAAAELAADERERGERAFVLLSCLGETGVEALRGALEKAHRAEAARALGRLRDSSAMADLVDLLDDEDAAARAAAARALGDIRDPRAVEGLLRASTDEQFVVREASIEALDRLGSAAVAFAIAAFVQPLLSGPAAGRAAAASFSPPGVEEAASEPEAPRAISSGAVPGTLDRLRAAARRARGRREDG
jgi:HEAT repeat protein